MNFGLWKITRDEKKFAQLAWLLYKYFGIKRKYPCGQKVKYLYCALSPNEENSVIINDGNVHEIRCKVCGTRHVMSNHEIKSVADMYSW